MATSMVKSSLHVEGKDDLYSIVNLLFRHGIDYDKRRSELPEFNEIGSCEGILAGMQLGVRSSTGRAIGFVLDADSPIESRWDSVRDRLQRVDVAVPKTPPSEGLVANSTKYKATVGVWLMPDNQHDGKLETFLQTLVHTDDALFRHAAESTQKATNAGAAFREVDRTKAELHAWLAWQENPGRPYGTAIRNKYFSHDSPAAIAFVQWFCRLFRVT